jgi:hypothetical protein
MLNKFIKLFHFLLSVILLGSIFIDNNDIKFLSFERLFLGDNFKNGIIYRIIKPIISYKYNLTRDYLHFYLIYIIILFYQLNKNNVFIDYYNQIKNLFNKK